MTREEAAAWLEHTPSWARAAAQSAGREASIRYATRSERQRTAAVTAAYEVAIIAAMWPLSPADALAGMRP